MTRRHARECRAVAGRPATERSAAVQPRTRRAAARSLGVVIGALTVASLVATACAPAASAAARPSTGRPAAAARSGTLLAWGDNRDGQLGDGSRTSRKIPVAVRLPHGTTVTSVRSGCSFTLALTSAGRVLAWGSNSAGQLGDGTTKRRTTPVRVRLPRGTSVTAIRAGCDFSLALTSKGRVLAWGDNSDGELGTGTTTSSRTPVAVKLAKGTKVRAVSAGGQHSLAITSTGRVLAWGVNFDLQLGDGTTATERHRPVAVKLPAGVTVTAAAAGNDHSLALTRAGGVLAWGSDRDGGLGDGSPDNSDIPVRPMLPRGTIARGLFAGCGDGLALTGTGHLLAWGRNSDGQLGDGNSGVIEPAVQVKLPVGSTATAISTGCQHSMAVTTTGQLLAWGDNIRGQLGDGTTQDRTTPVPVKLAVGLTVIAIGSGPASSSSFAIVRKPSP